MLIHTHEARDLGDQCFNLSSDGIDKLMDIILYWFIYIQLFKRQLLTREKPNLGLLFLLYKVSYKALSIHFPTVSYRAFQVNFHKKKIVFFFKFALNSLNYTWNVCFLNSILRQKCLKGLKRLCKTNIIGIYRKLFNTYFFRFVLKLCKFNHWFGILNNLRDRLCSKNKKKVSKLPWETGSLVKYRTNKKGNNAVLWLKYHLYWEHALNHSLSPVNASIKFFFLLFFWNRKYYLYKITFVIYIVYSLYQASKSFLLVYKCFACYKN